MVVRFTPLRQASRRAQRVNSADLHAHVRVPAHAQIPMSPSLIGVDAQSRLRSFVEPGVMLRFQAAVI